MKVILMSFITSHRKGFHLKRCFKVKVCFSCSVTYMIFEMWNSWRNSTSSLKLYLKSKVLAQVLHSIIPFDCIYCNLEIGAVVSD